MLPQEREGLSKPVVEGISFSLFHSHILTDAIFSPSSKGDSPLEAHICYIECTVILTIQTHRLHQAYRFRPYHASVSRPNLLISKVI